MLTVLRLNDAHNGRQATCPGFLLTACLFGLLCWTTGGIRDARSEEPRGPRSLTSATVEKHLTHFCVYRTPWCTPNACGVNCLYLLLRANGAVVSHTELLEIAPITSRGVSLQSLKELAAAQGVTAETVFAKPCALDAIPLPAIAHLGEGYDDHFVLITSVGEHNVTCIDGSNAEVKDLQRKSFVRQWSGHLLILTETSCSVTCTRLLLFVLGVLVVLSVLVAAQSRLRFQEASRKVQR